MNCRIGTTNAMDLKNGECPEHRTISFDFKNLISLSESTVPSSRASDWKPISRGTKNSKTKEKKIIELALIEDTVHFKLEEPVCSLCNIVTVDDETMIKHCSSHEGHLKNLSRCLAEICPNAEESDDSDSLDDRPKKHRVQWNLTEEDWDNVRPTSHHNIDDRS